MNLHNAGCDRKKEIFFKNAKPKTFSALWQEPVMLDSLERD
ncbi:MAG TPA: hypothetical protein V6C91_01465 [Coleofasciculaceae cyanobacterium]